MVSLKSKIYKKYRRKIYSNYRDVRGTHRLLIILKRWAANDIENIDSEPQTIFEKAEWDNLIILDACRHDLYEEVKGEKVEKRISLGSTTTEYIEKTFKEGNFSNVVYIAANPFFSDTFLEEFLGRKDFFQVKFDVFNTNWDGKEGTVLPDPVAEKTRTAKKLYSDSKIIIHFIQPHYPFIGFEDDKDKVESEDDWISGKEQLSVWERAEIGEISKEKVWEEYKRNLDYVLPKAQKLARDLEGKTVITSDHGNLAGENGLYGHPDRFKSKPLREVPWDEIN